MEPLLEPNKISEAMKSGLARMFADKDFSDYLNHSIAVANHNVLVSLKGNQPELARDFSIELQTLKTLLDKGKAMYVQTEKLRSKSLEELSNEQTNG